MEPVKLSPTSQADAWYAGMRAPIVAAPMYRVTTPRLVVEATVGGLVGVLPALNVASTVQLDESLGMIEEQIASRALPHSPWGVNLICHSSNRRFNDDIAVIKSHLCPLVVASVGSPRSVMDIVHGYGGRVWSDVISLDHARKAAACGVDGLVLVCAGAGGNTGWVNPFAFLKEVRSFYKGTIALAGAITDGAQARAVELLGADFAYVGTPFIAAHESAADDDYKNAVAQGVLEDVVLSKAASGIPANLLKESLLRLGLDPADAPTIDVGGWTKSAAWSAGHGIGAVKQRQSCGEIAKRLIAEYQDALKQTSPFPCLPANR